MVENELLQRQIWASQHSRTTVTAAAATAQAQATSCSIALPSGGVLQFNDTFSSILTDSIIFQAPCDDAWRNAVCGNSSGVSTVIKSDDPFYASVPPQIYALATATIISYMLVILIFITPRTFYTGGPGSGSSYGLRSFVSGTGGSSIQSVGRRPLLQKLATLTVAVSLTIATADTFRHAETQYNNGLMDSADLVEKVIGSVEIRVVRVISDTFLWLAQVQTLIRLYPRHKEKVTIKWLGFALVTCDTVFSILENFVSDTNITRPRSFQDAIPALSYLFEMAIALIYASCVIFYSLSKRRFAFWHAKMRNICLVALISTMAVLIPVVFFILDVSQPNIAVWGEYIRWVGSAAASVVVWEWVERIESLERDEKKDGILGREVFDGDEMLEMGMSDRKSGSSGSFFRFGKKSASTNDTATDRESPPRTGMRGRLPFKKALQTRIGNDKNNRPGGGDATAGADGGMAVTRPPQAATPISRSDTTSAASTVYQIRYHNISSPSPAIPEESAVETARVTAPAPGHEILATHQEESDENGMRGTSTADSSSGLKVAVNRDDSARQKWQAVANPFKRKRTEPPAEVAAQMAVSNARRSPAERYHNIRDRFSAFTSSQKGRLVGRTKHDPSPPMGVTVIPAQPRHSRAEERENGDSEMAFQSAREPPDQDRSSSKSSKLRNRKQKNLPVAYIPAPTRGGRTWSPDDLEAEVSDDSSAGSPHGSMSGGLRQADIPLHESGILQIPRGSLIIEESSRRSRDVGTNSTPTTSRNSNRTRGTTINSLNDRLTHSTSPRHNETPPLVGAVQSAHSRRETPRSTPSNALVDRISPPERGIGPDEPP